MATNYRADHVGSLLRPAEVLQARAEHIQGRLTLEQLRAIEDQAILSALEMQRQVGIDIISDGEMRRWYFVQSFYKRMIGIEPDRPLRTVGFEGYDARARAACRQRDGG